MLESAIHLVAGDSQARQAVHVGAQNLVLPHPQSLPAAGQKGCGRLNHTQATKSHGGILLALATTRTILSSPKLDFIILPCLDGAHMAVRWSAPLTGPVYRGRKVARRAKAKGRDVSGDADAEPAPLIYCRPAGRELESGSGCRAAATVINRQLVVPRHPPESVSEELQRLQRPSFKFKHEELLHLA